MQKSASTQRKTQQKTEQEEWMQGGDVVNGMDKDLEIGRDREGTEILLVDEQKSVWVANRRRKKPRPQKRNGTKWNERRGAVAGQLRVYTSMVLIDIDFA
jgi:hypothetical protein